jgi:hypothetical protein
VPGMAPISAAATDWPYVGARPPQPLRAGGREQGRADELAGEPQGQHHPQVLGPAVRLDACQIEAQTKPQPRAQHGRRDTGLEPLAGGKRGRRGVRGRTVRVQDRRRTGGSVRLERRGLGEPGGIDRLRCGRCGRQPGGEERDEAKNRHTPSFRAASPLPGPVRRGRLPPGAALAWLPARAGYPASPPRQRRTLTLNAPPHANANAPRERATLNANAPRSTRTRHAQRERATRTLNAAPAPAGRRGGRA